MTGVTPAEFLAIIPKKDEEDHEWDKKEMQKEKVNIEENGLSEMKYEIVSKDDIYNRHNPLSGHKYADVTDGEAYTFQRYNGLGKIHQNTEEEYEGGNIKSWYGVEVPPNILYTEDDDIPKGKKVGDVKQRGYIDMKKEKLYGKQIIDIRDNIINNNEDLLDLIEETPAYVLPETE